MKTLFLILFLPILVYCQSDGVLDCGYLSDTFVYKDFANVYRNYVGGCCTSACLKRLEEHYPGWRTPTEINPASWYVSMLYSLQCCKDTPSIAVITETMSTTTGTTPVTTPTTTTIPTTTSVTSTIKTTIKNQKLNCGWLEESNGGLCCTQRALNFLQTWDANWRKLNDIGYRTQIINILKSKGHCDSKGTPLTTTTVIVPSTTVTKSMLCNLVGVGCAEKSTTPIMASTTTVIDSSSKGESF
ncbi:hypothetical protein GCK72_004830 [Caenorhabditis remanei]|uniref:Uncharacterized protein n=1 Tax=Caenorhabditis remanei TaxID=31234 RepID=A0A6A5HCZ4_CAERE|nr:hypothetical protein GCK72_004830 [Caenorhabditis remanei]KAF1764879.1 hypothetical protein GCK72_004830 [Caenorhabditis remanei]